MKFNEQDKCISAKKEYSVYGSVFLIFYFLWSHWNIFYLFFFITSDSYWNSLRANEMNWFGFFVQKMSMRQVTIFSSCKIWKMFSPVSWIESGIFWMIWVHINHMV